jgi:DNA-binding CsgD family transcriptional regulator
MLTHENILWYKTSVQLTPYRLPPAFEVHRMYAADYHEKHEERIDAFYFHGALISVNHDAETPYMRSRSNQLRPREETILLLGAVGMSTGLTAENLGVSAGWVGNTRREANYKLSNRPCTLGEAAARAVAYGVLTVESPVRGTKSWFYAPELLDTMRGLAEGKDIRDMVDPRSEARKVVQRQRRLLGLHAQGDTVLYGLVAGLIEVPGFEKAPAAL